MKDLLIRNKLFDLVEAMTLSELLPVQYPNMAFTIPESGRYLEIIYLPNDDVSIVWGQQALTRGILRVNVVDKIDMGEEWAIGLQSQIATFFPKGLNAFYTGGKIDFPEFPQVQQGFEHRQSRIFPVSMRYQSHHI